MAVCPKRHGLKGRALRQCRYDASTQQVPWHAHRALVPTQGTFPPTVYPIWRAPRMPPGTVWHIWVHFVTYLSALRVTLRFALCQVKPHFLSCSSTLCVALKYAQLLPQLGTLPVILKHASRYIHYGTLCGAISASHASQETVRARSRCRLPE